jgi:PAS domain S-box-containing protein
MTTHSGGTFLQGDPQKQFEQLVARIDGIVWQADPQSFQFTFVSQQAERLLGYPLEQWFAPDFWVNHLHAEDRACATEFYLRATREKRSHDFEYRMIAADGQTIWLHDNVSVVEEAGEIVKLQGIMVDVSARREAEQRQRESEELSRLFAENTNDTITLLDLDGRRLYDNPSVSRLRNRPFDATVHLAFERIHPDDAALVRRTWEKVVAGEQVGPITYRAEAADGSWRWLEGFGKLVQHHGKPHVLGVNRDITDRKRAEEMHRAHLRFLESMDQVNRAIQATDDLEQMMGDVLDVFLCDRAWLVYPCDPEAATWCAAMERTRPEYPGAFALGVELPVDPEVVRTFQTLRSSGSPVRFGPTAEHPLPADVANRFHIQSQLVMAVYPKGDRPYAFGLHQCSSARVWTREEERLFQEIGRRLADALTSLLMLRRLRENESRLEEAQRIAHVGYWELDAGTGRVKWSDETYRIFGLQPQQRLMTREGLLERVHAEDRSRVAEAITQALRGGPRYNVEYRLVRPNGDVRIVHSQGDATLDSAGRPRGMFGAVQDITERRQAEDALQVSHNLLSAVFEATPDILFVKNLEGQVLAINSAGVRLLGRSRNEILGRDDTALLPREAARAIMQDDRRITTSGRAETFEEQVTLGGTTHTYLTTKDVYRDAQGNVAGLIGISRDVTERKQTEQALRESEELYRLLTENSNDLIYLLDLEGTIVYASPSVGRLLGRVPQSNFEVIHPDDLEAGQACWERMLAGSGYNGSAACAIPLDATGKVLVSVRVRDAGGTWHWLEAWNSLIPYHGRPHVLSVCRDVTERKRAEEALRESEERLRQAVRVSHLGIFDHDHLTETYYWSPEERAFHGWEAERPPNVSEFLALLHPEDRERIAAAIRRAHDPAGDGLFDVEQRIIRPDGEVRWLVTRSQTIFEGEGAVRRPVRTVGAVLDVTERKRGEESVRASLREKEVLLKEVHHRVKNNLQLISSLLALQAGQLKDRAAAEAFTESQNRVRSMALVHENLYRSGDLASIRLAGHLESLCAHLFRSYNVDSDRITLDLRVAETTLDLDRSIRLGLLVNELVSNALKHAFPAGRTGRVLVQLDRPRAGWYTLVVSDNGVGLPSHLVPGHSDSLGLQLVADLTEQLGGTPALDREGGTRFSIRFPTGCPEESRS